MADIVIIAANAKKSINPESDTMELIKYLIENNKIEAAKKIGSLFKYYHVPINLEKNNLSLSGILKLLINNNTGRTNNLNIVLFYIKKTGN